MGMLKKATNKMAYAKIGLYGDAGSGKTVTASKIAIGLHKFAKLDKPIAFFDTEPAASFVKPLFDQANIDLMVMESRSLSDLMKVMDEAEKECSIIIIDSVTHLWKDAMDSYIKKINDTRKKNAEQRGWNFKPINQIEFQDWRHIKGAWAKFTNRFLSSKLHCFVCGRAGTIYEYQDNERTGKKELISTGTRMATEKELGYEPSLLIELSKIVGKEVPLINRAFVEKDRNVMNPLTGKSFDFPGFENFKAHFEFLNIGGQHFQVLNEGNGDGLYDETGEDTFTYEKRNREIYCEEIKALLIKHGLDGSSADVKKKRVTLLEQIFNTGSWTKIENMRSHDIKDGLNKMQLTLETTE